MFHGKCRTVGIVISTCAWSTHAARFFLICKDSVYIFQQICSSQFINLFGWLDYFYCKIFVICDFWFFYSFVLVTEFWQAFYSFSFCGPTYAFSYFHFVTLKKISWKSNSNTNAHCTCCGSWNSWYDFRKLIF